MKKIALIYRNRENMEAIYHLEERGGKHFRQLCGYRKLLCQ